jgi:hypothetical protein
MLFEESKLISSLFCRKERKAVCLSSLPTYWTEQKKINRFANLEEENQFANLQEETQLVFLSAR